MQTYCKSASGTVQARRTWAQQIVILLSDPLQVALASNAVLKSSTSPSVQSLLKASPAATNATQADQSSLPGSAGNPTAIYSTGRFGPLSAACSKFERVIWILPI